MNKYSELDIVAHELFLKKTLTEIPIENFIYNKKFGVPIMREYIESYYNNAKIIIRKRKLKVLNECR